MAPGPAPPIRVLTEIRRRVLSGEGSLDHYCLTVGLRFEKTGIIYMKMNGTMRLTMKPIVHSSLATGLSLLTLVVCFSIQQVSAADEKTRIETEQEFREIAVGKKLVYKIGEYVIAHDDGTMSGYFGGKPLSGNWNWEDGYYCRTGKLGGKSLGQDCQIVELSGNKLTFIRKKGKGGDSGPYKIEPES